MDKEVALAKARALTGFADDVRTPDDVREVLKKLVGDDPDVMKAYAENTHLCSTARGIAREEYQKLLSKEHGSV